MAPVNGRTAASEATPGSRSTWPGGDGTPLYVRHWPARGQAWATLLIIHGIAEHSGRYEQTARLFAAGGLDVHSFDLRGHGLSGGQRVYVDNWQQYLDDLEVRLLAVRKPDVPMVLFGHSMGALIALDYVCSGRPQPRLLILSAPPLAAKVPAWQRAAVPVLNTFLPRLVMKTPISGEQLSRNPAVAKAYFADPLVQPRSSVRLAAELFGAMRRCRKELEELSVPTLVVHGACDTLVPLEASEPLCALPVVERRVLSDLRHEVLNEPEGPEIVGKMILWMKDRLARPKSRR